MALYILKRLLFMIPTLIAITMVVFVVINLPPGDYVDRLVAEAKGRQEVITPQEAEGMRQVLGLREPLPVQYVRWISNIVLHGDFGTSFRWKLPVNTLIWQRLALTFDTGQRGTARVNETRFDSRNPDATVVVFTGTGPLA